MKIHVPSIPESGKLIEWSERDPWVQELLIAKLTDLGGAEVAARGQVQLFRTNTNVTLTGEGELELKPTCHRCGEVFAWPLKLPLHRHLVPYFDDPETSRDEDLEVELNEEDLDFSCYHHDEIDLADLIAEEVLLALPMRFVCEEDCQGLCVRCGAKLKDGACSCPELTQDSPFAVLKDFSLPKGKK